MDVGVVGMDFKSAPIGLREEFARVCAKRFRDYGVLLETCNRTELYFSGPDLPLIHIQILEVFREEISKPFEFALYSYFGRDALLHSTRVTAGLESGMIGETEIQGQVKRAYQRRIKEIQEPFHTFFQKSLKMGKEIRQLFVMPKVTRGLEEIISELSPGKVMFVGNSVMNRKLMRSFETTRSCVMVSRHGREVWEGLEAWKEYDLVIVATTANSYVLSPPLTELSHPVTIVDLSVPRNVDPLCQKHPGINLVHLSELEKQIIQEQSSIAVTRYVIRAVEQQIRLFYARRRVACAMS
jgi:glutamyl-tRNA reductase